jgi:tRNA dimethylallyltransferase
MLAGTSAPAAALARIAAQIRQYAKRQRTWFRHQLPQLETITAAGDERQAERIVKRLDRDRDPS